MIDIRVGAVALMIGLVTAAGGQPLAAQGTLSGRITDRATSAPLAGATITVHGARRSVESNGEGRYRITDLAAGVWTVEVQMLGFRATVVTDVVVRTARSTVLDVGLDPLPVEMHGIEVRPSVFREHEDARGSRVEFSSEEIRRAPGAAGDVSRIVQGLPSLAKVNDQSNALIVRGGSPLENLFLVDGIEVANINHFPAQGSSGGAIGLLNVSLIRDATLSAGGFGAEYGDRLSSVMDIRLREGNREAVDAQLDLNFVGAGGVIEGPLAGGRGAWLISARRSYIDWAVKAFDVGSTVAPSYGDYQAKLTFDVTDRQRLGLIALWADDHMRSDLDVARENAMLAFGSQNLLQGTTGLTWSALWSERLRSTTSVAWSYARFDEDYLETATGGTPLFRNRSREHAIRMRHATELHLPGVVLAMGGDASSQDARYDNRYAAHVGPLGDTVPPLVVNDALTGAQFGAFASAALTPAPWLTVTLGARGDHSTVTGNTSWSPRASAAFRMSDRLTLTAATGVYHQTLPMVLLAQHADHRALADPRAWHAVVGMSHLLRDDLRLSIEAYHKRTDRLPVDPTQPGLLPIDELFYGYGFLTARDTLVATGSARTSGVELLMQKRLTDRFYGMVGASLFRSEYRAADGEWRNRAFDNRYLVSAEGGWRAGGGWDLSARWTFAGGAPYTPLDLVASETQNRSVLDDTRINAARFPAYHSLSMRVDRRFQIGRSTLRAFISVWNVYGRRNVAQFYWNTETGREEPIRQWGRLPVFGIEWAF